MQRILIVLVVGLLAVGCLTPEQKQKRLRDSVVGEYERKNKYGYTYKRVLLDNGIIEYYKNSKKTLEAKWTVVKEEIHVIRDGGFIDVRRINSDRSITKIAVMRGGKRIDLPKEKQVTYKRIK